jgi:predicted dehydrogenase
MKHILFAAALAACVAANADMRIGIIGCDTEHAEAFTELMNVKKDPDCAGFRVTAAYKWGSRDIRSSTNRYAKIISHLESMGVKMVPTIADLLGEVDAVLLETCDGRPHFEQALQVFRSGKRVFIDKPVAASLADAIRIADAGREAGVPWFCSSALRYVKKVNSAHNGEFGKIRGASCWTPNELEPTQSEFFWYAIHGAEPLFAIMGTGCVEVRCTGGDTEDLAVGTWEDGRIGTMRAMSYKKRGAAHGGVIFPYKKAPVDMGTYEGYKPLLVEILKFFKTGEPPVTPEETLEIYAFLEAAAKSKKAGGAPVKIADGMAEARRSLH